MIELYNVINLFFQSDTIDTEFYYKSSLLSSIVNTSNNCSYKSQFSFLF